MDSSLAQQLNPSKILLIRLARLGDVILLVPAIKLIRRRFPTAHISVLVGHRCAPILEMCSAVDEVIATDRVAMRDGSKWVALKTIFELAERVRKFHYDLVIDFHSFRETNLLAWYSGASSRLGLKRAHSAYLGFCFNISPVLEDKWRHVSSVFISLLAPLGIQPSDEDIRLDLSTEDLSVTSDFLFQRGVAPNSCLFGFNVGAGSPGRMWPKERFASLAKKLSQDYDATVILFSGPQDGGFAKEVAELIEGLPTIVANQLSLKALASVMSRCKILISNDTGPMHLGPALGVPTLGLFSLGYPENYCPLGKASRFIKRHPIETLQVEEVYTIVKEMIEGNSSQERLSTEFL
jgi:heptosyltransferase-2